MLKKSYKRSNFDHCVYYKQLQGNQYIYLLIYVDDMLITCRDKNEIRKLTMYLKSEFEMKDLGEAKRILGIDIIRDRQKGTITLLQFEYLKRVVEVFGMENRKPISTPIPPYFKLCVVKGELLKDEEKYMKGVPYSNVVDSLIYAMIGIRPDIAYGVSLVRRFMGRPSLECC